MSASPSASTPRGLRAPSDSVSGHGAAIRPFRIEYPESDILELRHRIAATRWPEKETVSDTSQGVPLLPLQHLARYWATDCDWRKCEAKLNALPQFTTEIDGLTSRSAAAPRRDRPPPTRAMTRLRRSTE